VTLRVAAIHGEALERPAERRIPRARSRAITVEQVSECAYDAVDSLLASDVIVTAPEGVRDPVFATESAAHDDGVANSPPPPATAPEPPPAAPPPGRGLAFGLGAYAFVSERSVADRDFALAGGGGAIELGVGRGTGRPSLWISIDSNATFEEHSSRLTIETGITSLRAVPTVVLLDHQPFVLEAGIGGGIDVLRSTPRDMHTLGGPPAPTETAASGVLTGQVTLRATVSSGAGLVLAAGVDYDPSPYRYVEPARPGTPNTILQLWSIRPSAILGLCVPLAGEGACSSPP
jgi:hypothetical protein